MEVSVIMPVYGVEKYIEQSVNSVCEQDFKEFELILVDDGTKDDSISVAQKTIRDRCSYKVVHKENGGLPSARNYGLDNSESKYVCFIDSDDIISENHISSLYTLCEKKNLDIAFAEFEETEISNRDGTSTVEEENKMSVLDGDFLMRRFLERKIKIHCCAMFIRRSFLDDNGLRFNEKLKYGEDIDFMWRILPRVNKIGSTGIHSYKYLQRPQSLVSQQNIDRVVYLVEEFYKTVETNQKNYPEKEHIWKYLGGRAYLTFCKSFAKFSSYEMFDQLLEKSQYRKHLKGMQEFPAKDARYFSMLLLLSKRLFYIASKLI